MSVTNSGKHIAMDATVQSLFQSLSALYAQLMHLIGLRNHAREAGSDKSLNDIQAQHADEMRQQELEQELLRRMQMDQKLELVRKPEYLDYQQVLQTQRQRDMISCQVQKQQDKFSGIQ